MAEFRLMRKVEQIGEKINSISVSFVFKTSPEGIHLPRAIYETKIQLDCCSRIYSFLSQLCELLLKTSSLSVQNSRGEALSRISRWNFISILFFI